MKELKFTDSQIKECKTFDIENIKLTIPYISKKNIDNIIKSISGKANEYYSNNESNPIRECYNNWIKPESKYLKRWLKLLSEVTGFSQETIYAFGIYPLKNIDFDVEKILAIPDKLRNLINTNKYRVFTPWENGYIKGNGMADLKLFQNPKLILHILAGNVVGSSWLTLIIGYLLNCPQIIKLSHKDIASFLIFLETLNDVSPEFRNTIFCGYYPSSDKVNKLAIKKADIVLSMGSDETMKSIDTIINKSNPLCRFMPHGYKIGFQVISKEYVTKEIAELSAWGVISHDQNACFTPVNIFLEKGGELSDIKFAEYLAENMEKLAVKIPPKNSIKSAEKVINYREEKIQRKLLGENIIILASKNMDYTIIIDYENSLLVPTCQERTVIIKPIDSIQNIEDNIKRMGSHLETVGIAVNDEVLFDISEKLSYAGATNIKSIGSEYIINITDNHDGIFNTAANMYDGLRWINVNYRKIDLEIEKNLNFKKETLENLEIVKKLI